MRSHDIAVKKIDTDNVILLFAYHEIQQVPRKDKALELIDIKLQLGGTSGGRDGALSIRGCLDAVFVWPHRLLCVMNHHFGRFTLGVSVSLAHQRVGNQSMAVVSDGVTHGAQLAGSVAFAIKPCIGVDRGCVRVIAATLPLKLPP